MPKHEARKPDDNKELVVHALEGTALVALTAYAARKILRGRHLHDNRTEPEDLVHSSVVKALTRSRQFRGDSDVSTWLHSILINNSKDESRKFRGRKIKEIDTDPEPHLLSVQSEEDDPEESAIMKAERERILLAIKELSEPEQIVIFKHYFEDMRIEDIAAELGMPIATVKSHAHRARAKLARQLGKEEAA